MATSRTFILNGMPSLSALWGFLKQFGDFTASPVRVVVSPYRHNRSDEQNRLMWARLGQLATEGFVEGRLYNAETWNEQMKRLFLPDTCRSGKEKWRRLPSGVQILTMSTSDLDVEEMTDYLTQMDVFAAELGVVFLV